MTSHTGVENPIDLDNIKVIDDSTIEVNDSNDDENVRKKSKESSNDENQLSIGNADKTVSIESVPGVTSEFSCRQFYESSYDQTTDDWCFEKIDLQSNELRKQITENQFKFMVKHVKDKNIRSIIDKLNSATLFMVYFELKSFPGKTKKSKPIIDLKVRSGFLKNISRMCILIDGDHKIYSFSSNEMVCAFKDEICTHGLEFKNESVSAVCFDVKLSYKIFKCCFEIDDSALRKITWHDPKVAHWLLNPDADEPNCLLDILQFYLKINDVAKFVNDIDEMAIANNDYKVLSQSILLYPVMSELRKQLIQMKLFDSYINVEIPVILIFGEMELTGFAIDKLYLRKSVKDWSGLLVRLKNEVKKRNDGQDVNPRSSQQVHQFLDKHKLYDQYVKFVNIPENVTIDSLKTGREVLEKMRDFSDLPGFILDQRLLHHLIDSAKTIELEVGNSNSVMGIYKHFISTGRVSMHDPNLLGIDKDHKIQIDSSEQELCIKKAFTSKTGFVLIGADYSQLELRILTALSREDHLSDIFELEKDPFKMISARIKNKDVDEITKFERDTTKQIIYALIYGMGIKRLTANLGVENEEVALKFLEEFYAAFPKLQKFIERCKADARINSYIQTLFGRRRLLPEINSEDESVRLGEERKAVNSTIQGSAADLVKLTMLKINKAIQDQKLDAEFLLQIHDELIFQVRDDQQIINNFTQMLNREMTSCGSVLKTKFAIKIMKGKNWGEMNEVLLSTEKTIIDEYKDELISMHDEIIID